MAALTFSHGGKRLALKSGKDVIKLLAQVLPADLRDEFTKIANDPRKSLEDFLDEKRAELERKIPEKHRFLFSTFGELEEAAIDVAEWSTKSAAGVGKLAIDAGARLALDRIDVGETSEDTGLAVERGRVLARLQANGSLSADAELEAGSVLKAGINFGLAAEHKLNYYVAMDDSAYVAELVPELTRVLVDPSDLSAVLDALDAGPLVRIERFGAFTATLGLTVAISREIQSLIAGLPAAGAAGTSFVLEYEDAADFALAVTRHDAGFAVELRKTRSKARSTVLKLGMDVTIKGFKNRLVQKITHVLPEDPGLAPLLEQLDEMTDRLSAEVLTKKLEQELEARWPDAEPVIALLVGEETAKGRAKAIREELRDKIEAALAEKANLWSAAAETAAKTVAARIAEELGVTGRLRTKIESYVGRAVASAVAGFQEKLGGAASELIDSSDVAALLRPWEFVGKKVTDALEALASSAANRADKVAAALELVNERYVRFRQAVLAAVKEKAEEELALTIISRKERTLTTAYAVRFDLAARSEAAAALYRALWLGDLRDIGELVANLRRAPEASGLDGEYVTVAGSLDTHTLSLSFFGLKLAGQLAFGETVEVGIDVNGKLIVASSRAELEKMRKRFGESQSVSAAWQVDYLRHEMLDAPLFVKLSVTDKRFKIASEVDDFFGPLEKSELMRSGIADDVEAALFESGTKTIRDVRLSINVVLRWSDWLRIVGRDLNGQEVPDLWQSAAVSGEYLDHVKVLAPIYVREAEAYMARTNTTDLVAFLVKLGSFRFERDAKRFLGEPTNVRLNPSFRMARRLARAVHDLHSGLASLQGSWSTLIARLPESERFDPEAAEDLAAEIQAVNSAFVQTFDRAFSTGLVLDDPGEINWLTASALRLFQARVDLPNPYLSCTFESERTGRLIFS